jgi:hypothetical protein
MNIWDTYNTPLNLGDELRFQITKANSPFRNDSGYDYDYRGFYNRYGNLTPQATNGHLTDEYKKPNHPTFSIESNYYTGQPYAIDWNSNYGKVLQLLGY